jgi:hypothetical protein
MEKFVVLEHLLMPDRGFKFWTLNSENNTRLLDGTVAYKEVYFTSDADDAKDHCNANLKKVPTMYELEKYYKNESK